MDPVMGVGGGGDWRGKFQAVTHCLNLCDLCHSHDQGEIKFIDAQSTFSLLLM